MGREYRPNVRESAVISKLDHQKESQRYHAINQLRHNIDELADRISMKLIEERLIETTSKGDLQDQIQFALQKILDSEEFEIQYETANLRTLVPRPNFVSLFVTALCCRKTDRPQMHRGYFRDGRGNLRQRQQAGKPGHSDGLKLQPASIF